MTPLGVTPIPLTLTVLEPTTKLFPFKVTPIVAPAAPEGLLMEVSVGMAPDTVNVTPLLVPSGVVTVIVRAPIGAEEPHFAGRIGKRAGAVLRSQKRRRIGTG